MEDIISMMPQQTPNQVEMEGVTYEMPLQPPNQGGGAPNQGGGGGAPNHVEMEGITFELPQQTHSFARKEEVDAIKQTLFKAAMKGEWERVVEIYSKHRSVQETKITRTEDTVLHVAVAEGKRDIVKRLVKEVADADTLRILGLKNEKGNTPLHLAAALGMVEVCAAMAKPCPRLVTVARNKLGETPLFLAAKYGMNHTFFALQDTIEKAGVQKPGDFSYCRRNVDGNTILHQAITGEHFDLAFEIIDLYPELVNKKNERGETALHYLANKPYVFKSGSRYGLFDTLIYTCIFVDSLKVKYPKYKGKNHIDGIHLKEGSSKLPENYKTCFDAFEFLMIPYNTIAHSFGRRSSMKCYIADEEDPNDQSKHDMNPPQEHGASACASQSPQVNQESHDMGWFPQNYNTCVDLFKLALKFLVVILGIGLWRTQEIEKKKRKHVHACKIMDELVGKSVEWGWYEKDGKKPEGMSLEKEISIPKELPATNDADINEDRLPIINDISRMEEQNITTSKEQQGGSIMVAAKGGAVDTLKKILDNFSLAVQHDVDNKKNIIILEMNEAAASSKEPDGVTPILVAAKNGVKEIVEKILDSFPVAIQDMDSNDKNIVLLAVENRQPSIYKLILKRSIMKESVIGRVDKEGNSALHLAATLGQNRPWNIPGEALQMQWEIKWYKFVQNSMDPEFFRQYNYKDKTAREIFTEKHEKMVERGGSWLNSTSQSCSVVAALIATVAFASATTVPGGINEGSGFPVLENKVAFQIFAISALVALCFSVTSLIMFLAILTSRYQEWDFEYDLPVKLILGLTSLFMSIAAMLVSFCAGHFFVVEKKLKYVAYPIYGVMCLPVTFFATAQFPLYFDLIRSTFAHVPVRTEKMRSF